MNDQLFFQIVDKKVIMHTKGKVCESSDELLSSRLFFELTKRCVYELSRKKSSLLKIFNGLDINDDAIKLLVDVLYYLAKLPASQIPNLVKGSELFFKDQYDLSQFVEFLYNYWRSFDRFLICNSMEGDILDKRPYRTFNHTIETLTHLVRGVYRDIQENITLMHPRIYRQVAAGAEIAAISIIHNVDFPAEVYKKLNKIPIIRQILLNPPLILNPPMNKRSGQFIKVNQNPLELIDINSNEWLCYPAKVGSLIILIYFHEKFFELGFSLCNLFELADDEDLTRYPDAVFTFGVPGDILNSFGDCPTIFYEDIANDMLVAAIPNRNEFGYFGYLKKMVLTLHNIKMIKAGKLPFHGAFVKVLLYDDIEKNILIIGDTGAGKSETLEALRILGDNNIRDLVVIADDMGSIDINDSGTIIGYGTEIGAFLRLDDLRPGYAFGQVDRSIMMSPAMVNARIILPVTTYDVVVRGYKIDMVLYANNYEEIDDEHPVIERFLTVEQAVSVFKEGTVMSKGTTTSTGIVHSYYANIFGPPQYKELHDKLAMIFFNAFFNNNIFVGQMRTRLGINGYETIGPEEAAKELLAVIKS